MRCPTTDTRSLSALRVCIADQHRTYLPVLAGLRLIFASDIHLHQFMLLEKIIQPRMLVPIRGTVTMKMWIPVSLSRINHRQATVHCHLL